VVWPPPWDKPSKKNLGFGGHPHTAHGVVWPPQHISSSFFILNKICDGGILEKKKKKKKKKVRMVKLQQFESLGESSVTF
jgi:hypothetical protein